MRRLILTVICFVFIPSFLTAVPKEKLVYTAVSQSKNEATIKKGIKTAISDMSFITKPIAKRKLTKSNLAFKKLTFDFPGNKVSITHDARKAVVSPASGAKAKWTREDGETFTVTQKVGEDTITQKFIAGEGVKTLTYKFSQDFSTVKVSVRLDSPKLPAPLKYTMNYKK